MSNSDESVNRNSDTRALRASLEDLPPEIRRLIEELQSRHLELQAQNEQVLRAQREAQQASQRYLDLYHNAPVGYLTIDREQKVVDINRTGEGMLALSQGGAGERPFSDFVAPEDRQACSEYLRAVLDGQPGQAGQAALEVRCLRADGTSFHAKLQSARVDGANGQGALCRTVLSDITQRRQAELALRSILAGTASATGEDFFRSLVRRLAEAVNVRYAMVGELAGPGRARTLAVWTGKDFAENFEYDLQGTPCQNVLNRSTCLYPRDVRQQFPTDAMLTKMEVESYLGAPLQDLAGNVLGLLAVLDVDPMEETSLAQDLLAVFAARAAAELTRQRAERQRIEFESKVRHTQKLESLGILAGGIAHDFNNLLMVILGNADMALQEAPRNSPVRNSIEEIRKASKRAADLTNQMLAYAGKGRFNVQPTQLNDLIEEMGQLLRASLSRKIVLNTDLEAGLPLIQADAAQARQVVMNLFLNAAEAVAEESGMVTIQTSLLHMTRGELARTVLDGKLPEGPYVCLTVTDTGCGMDAETLGRLFDPFFSTKFVGRGLGLSAVLGIVRGHRGTMQVDSQPGRGTTFKVLLPPAPGECPPEAPADASQVRPDWGASRTVLLADDEEGVRSVGCRMLQRMGFAVLAAADGAECVRLFQEHAEEISLVLLDMSMPKMSGREAFHEMRRIRPDVPVILCSGYTERDARGRFEETDLAGFLQKPFETEALLAKLRGVLKP